MRSRKKRLSPGCHKLGKTLGEMITELRVLDKMIKETKKNYWTIQCNFIETISPKPKIKYPLRRDSGGRMMKGEKLP